MLTVVPMTVWGREKRHSAPSRPACRRGYGDRDPVHRPPPSRARRASAIPTGTKTAPASEPSTKRPANTSRRAAAHRRAQVLGRTGECERRRARDRLAAAHRDRVAAAAVAVPARRDRDELDVLEARALEPLAVLVLGREQHPQLGERAQDAVAGRHRPDHDPHPAGPQHAVGLGDPALGRGPVLDRAGRDVAVEVVGRQRQRLGVAEHLRAGRERRLALGVAQLVRALVEHRHAVGVDPLDDPLGREARTCSGVEGPQPPLVEPRRVEGRRSHLGGPEQRVHPAVVARREEAVEPVRLLLVLDQPHAPPVTVSSQRTPGRLDRSSCDPHPPSPLRDRQPGRALGRRARGPAVRHADADAARALADPRRLRRPDLHRAVQHLPLHPARRGRHVVAVRAVRADLDAGARLRAAVGQRSSAPGTGAARCGCCSRTGRSRGATAARRSSARRASSRSTRPRGCGCGRCGRSSGRSSGWLARSR